MLHNQVIYKHKIICNLNNPKINPLLLTFLILYVQIVKTHIMLILDKSNPIIILEFLINLNNNHLFNLKINFLLISNNLREEEDHKFQINHNFNNLDHHNKYEIEINKLIQK